MCDKFVSFFACQWPGYLLMHQNLWQLNGTLAEDMRMGNMCVILTLRRKKIPGNMTESDVINVRKQAKKMTLYALCIS